MSCFKDVVFLSGVLEMLSLAHGVLPLQVRRQPRSTVRHLFQVLCCAGRGGMRLMVRKKRFTLRRSKSAIVDGTGPLRRRISDPNLPRAVGWHSRECRRSVVGGYRAATEP